MRRLGRQAEEDSVCRPCGILYHQPLLEDINIDPRFIVIVDIMHHTSFPPAASTPTHRAPIEGVKSA